MGKLLLIAAALAGTAAFAANPVVEELMNELRAGSAVEFSAERGRQLWSQEFLRDGEARSCASCHTGDLRKDGRHAATGKAIEPLAPSVHSTRLTERAEIEKWFGRNCKWTYGRACTPEEKGHFLAFIQAQ
jgi:hypothetical protein